MTSVVLHTKVQQEQQKKNQRRCFVFLIVLPSKHTHV